MVQLVLRAAPLDNTDPFVIKATRIEQGFIFNKDSTFLIDAYQGVRISRMPTSDEYAGIVTPAYFIPVYIIVNPAGQETDSAGAFPGASQSHEGETRRGSEESELGAARLGRTPPAWTA